MKKCTKCNIEKPFELFYKTNQNKDGYRSNFKECMKNYLVCNKEIVSKKRKEYYNKNRDEIAKKRKEKYNQNNELICKERRLKYIDNKKSILSQSKKYRDKNKEILSIKSKIYACKNKESIYKYQKEYRSKNKDKLRLEKKIWKNNKDKTDSIYRLKRRLSSSISKYFRKFGYKKKSKTIDIVGCSHEFFKEYIESQFKEGMTWDNIHLDHIKPLSIAKTEEEVLQLNHYTNFQPLFIEDNLKKSNKLICKQLRLI